MRVFLLFLVTLFSLNSWAQKEYISYHFNQKNGLPQSSVNDLRFDNNLFLWISTEAGLVRYDGNAFRSFTVESDPFIKNDRFRWIITSPQNQLFISNSSGTIYTTENNKVIGSLMITYEWSDWRCGQVLWIQSVYIISESRGKGVFGLMYKQIQGLITPESGNRGIRLYVDKTNTRAQKVYEKLGMNGEHYQLYEWMGD